MLRAWGCRMTGAQPTVLIVDDSEGVCLTLSMMLEKSGYRTQCVHDLSEGLRVAHEGRYDVALIDRTLGHESGLQLAEDLVRTSPATRLVVMSGSITLRGEMNDHPEIKHLPVLIKPFSRIELLECIRTVLGRAA